jgi:mRNA interferase MazF
MITSAANRGWAGDVPLIDRHSAAGLPAPSIVRTTKIATIEARHVERIGRLDSSAWSAVVAELRAILPTE